MDEGDEVLEFVLPSRNDIGGREEPSGFAVDLSGAEEIATLAHRRTGRFVAASLHPASPDHRPRWIRAAATTTAG
jgi:hypothetical protein